MASRGMNKGEEIVWRFVVRTCSKPAAYPDAFTVTLDLCDDEFACCHMVQRAIGEILVNPSRSSLPMPFTNLQGKE